MMFDINKGEQYINEAILLQRITNQTLYRLNVI